MELLLWLIAGIVAGRLGYMAWDRRNGGTVSEWSTRPGREDGNDPEQGASSTSSGEEERMDPGEFFDTLEASDDKGEDG